MDRQPSSYLDRVLNESKPRANAMDGWLLALVVFCLFAGRALYCANGDGPFQACMQSGMPRVIGMSLQAGAVILAIWVGPKIGWRLNSRVLGYFSGGTIFLALSALLLWLGIVQP
jgi:hypothetical protein